MKRALQTNRRILLVDDNPAIHEDFRKILCAGADDGAGLDADALALFGGEGAAPTEPAQELFEVEGALQGQEALEKVKRSLAENRPYAMVFMDMRMPPGWDGLTTLCRLWEADPRIEAVLCTAYSDRSWEEIQRTLLSRDRWLVLKKPFDKIEVVQLSHALTEKWSMARLGELRLEAMEAMVRARTEDLVRANQVKHEFLANVSHELLTPMNAICGLVDILLEDPVNGEQEETLQQVRQSGDTLLRLITQVLDFNRAEAGTLPARPVEFQPTALIDEVVRDKSPEAMAKGLRLTIDACPSLPANWLGPAEIIRKALAPLVDNAVKFTSQGGVTVRVRHFGEMLEFSVADTGAGLTLQQLDLLKVSFAQLDGGMARRSTGIGLGLPLVERLARVAGGELKLSGEPNQGVVARFTVRASAQAPV